MLPCVVVQPFMSGVSNDSGSSPAVTAAKKSCTSWWLVRIPCLLQQWMAGRQLMCVPGCEPMPDRLAAHLVFRHGRNDLVVHQQAINVQRLVTRRVGCLELDRFATFCILDAREQSRLEQFGLVFELLHTRMIPKHGMAPPGAAEARGFPRELL